MNDPVDIHDDVKLLHSMGYAQELKRRMSGFSNFAISFSIICILAGGITMFPAGFSAVGGAAAGIGWLIGTLFCLLVAISMAQVGSAYPTAGGLYHWSSILGGKGWGWATAWLNLSGLIFVTASVNVGAYIIIINTFGPLLGIDPSTLTTTHQVIGLSLITFSQALFNHFGIRVTTLLTDLSGYLIFLVATVLTIVLLVYAPSLDFSRLFTFTNFSGETGGGVWPARDSIVTLFLLGLLLPIYTITGYDASAHTSEETVGAAKNVPKGILRSVYWSGIFGYFMVCAFVLAMPSPEQGAAQGANMFYWLMKEVLPRNLEIVLLCGIAISNYLCGLACVTSTSRMTFAFARDGGLPFSKKLRHVSSKHQTPVNAIWVTAIISVACTLYAPVFTTLVTACVIFLYLSYVMPAAVGIFAYGKTWTKMGPFDIGPWYRVVSVICVLGVLVLFYIGVQPPNDKALTITGLMIVVLLVAWFAGVRKRFQGPPSEEQAKARLAKLQELEQRVGEAGMKF